MGWRGLAIVLLLTASSSTAAARELNYQNYLIGERASAMGGAFVAMSGDATSSYYNPAGIAAAYHRGISLSASVYQASWEDYQGALTLPVGLSADMSSREFHTFPSSLAYTYPLDDNERGASFHHILAFSVLVPDLDRFDGEIGTATGLSQWDLKGAFKASDTTYWVGPSYGIELWGRLRLGVSLFFLAHLSEYTSNIGTKRATSGGPAGTLYSYNTANFSRSGFSLSMLTQVGAQVDLWDGLTIGLTVRPPNFGTFYSRVSELLFRSSFVEDAGGNPAVTSATGYADRVESDQIQMNYRLATALAAGIAYQREKSWAVSADLWLHLPLPRYFEFSGPVVYPTNPLGVEIRDPKRALDPNVERQSVMVVNARLGGEIWMNETWLLRAGFYTNFSSVDTQFYEQTAQRREASLILPTLRRFGFTFGLGKHTRRSTSAFTLAYVYGEGGAFSLNELFQETGDQVEVRAHTLTFVLAGSANL